MIISYYEMHNYNHPQLLLDSVSQSDKAAAVLLWCAVQRRSRLQTYLTYKINRKKERRIASNIDKVITGLTLTGFIDLFLKRTTVHLKHI